MIIQCLGCDKISFASEYSDETMNFLGEDGEWVNAEVIYNSYPEPPERTFKSRFPNHEERKFENIPDLIQMLYTQIVTAFNTSSYLLTAVGLRMLIEGICKDLNITEGYILIEDGTKAIKNGAEVRNKKLVGKVNGLVENGIIVQKQAEILHQIREFGNSIVHELIVPKRKTILLALEVSENMIYNIYELEKYSIK